MSKFYVISGDRNAIGNVYDLNDKVRLSKLCITWTEKDSSKVKRYNDHEEPSYTVYDNREQFLEAYSLMPYKEKRLHEVILDVPQKIKFDIDAKRSSDNPTERIFTGTQHDFEEMMEEIITCIQGRFHWRYDVDLPRKNIIMCDSSNEYKFSRHIIINGYSVSGCKQAEQFAKDVIEDLPEKYSCFMDRSVYKPKQNFRITGSHKDGSTRTKVLLPYIDPQGVKHEYHIIDTFIAYTRDTIRLKNIEHLLDADELYVKEIQLEGSDMIDISRIVTAAGLDRSHQYVSKDGAMLKYKRIRPSICDICQHEHTGNGMFIRVYKVGTLAEVFQYCYRWNKQNPENKRRLSIGTFITEHPDDGPAIGPDAKALSMLERAINEPFVEDKLLLQQLQLVHKYEEPTLRPFELAKTTFVHAGMKMGKTKTLKEYLSAYFKNDGIVTHVIRFMSFRQTFGNNIKASFTDFALYSDVKGDLDSQEKLIVQIESLSRLTITPSTAHPDLLILDESESIFEQLGSGLIKNFSKAYATFEWLLRNSKYVIAMDANMTDRTFNVIKAIRGIDDSVYHRNSYRNAFNDKYLVTSAYSKWVACLRVAIGGDERVAVVANSIKEAKEINHMLCKVFPGKHIQLYSSETSTADKKKDFADVNNTWNKLDILIYTPTVSAGVSFEQKHFDKVFAYFTDHSCNAETCIQMLGRIRDVKTKTYFICLKLRGNNLSTETPSILKDLSNSRDQLFEGMNMENLQVEYTTNGTRTYHRSTYLTVWLENARIVRISKNNFARRFIYLLRSVGAVASSLDDQAFTEHSGMVFKDEDGNIDPEILSWLEDRVVATNDLAAIESKKMVEAAELSYDEYDIIHAKKLAQEDINPDDLVAYEKATLRRRYSYYEAIDEGFVATYNHRPMLYKYFNLSKIIGDKPVIDMIKDFRHEEATYSSGALAGDVAQQQSELNYRFMSQKHMYVHQLVTLLGFADVLDNKYVPEIIANQALKDKMKTVELVKKVCAEFEIKTPTASKLNGQLMDSLINVTKSATTSMYGIVLKRTGDMLKLEQNNDFAPRGKVVVGKPSL
jgi:hypothetical protein